MNTADRYTNLLGTHSPTQALPEANRHEPLVGIQALIEEPGGTMESRHTPVLYVGRIAG